MFGCELDEVCHADAVLLELLPVHVAQDANGVLQSSVVGSRDLFGCADGSIILAEEVEALLPGPCVVKAASDGSADVLVAAAGLAMEQICELHRDVCPDVACICFALRCGELSRDLVAAYIALAGLKLSDDVDNGLADRC